MTREFGWLDPQGNFFPVEFEEHEAWALEMLKKIGEDPLPAWGNGGTVLVKRGWALIHNPCLDGNAPYVEGCWLPRTKAQREFLFDYFVGWDRPDLAIKYFEDEWFEELH